MNWCPLTRRFPARPGWPPSPTVTCSTRRVLSIEHIGSAHTDDELAVLLQIAEERRHAGQLALDLGDVGAGTVGTRAVVEGTASLILWEVLAGIYDGLGLDRLGDATFRALVLARVIGRPASWILSAS